MKIVIHEIIDHCCDECLAYNEVMQMIEVTFQHTLKTIFLCHNCVGELVYKFMKEV